MKHILTCRRTGIAIFGMCILGAALLMGKADTSMAIAGICMGLAAANSHEKKGSKPKNNHKPNRSK